LNPILLKKLKFVIESEMGRRKANPISQTKLKFLTIRKNQNAIILLTTNMENGKIK